MTEAKSPIRRHVHALMQDLIRISAAVCFALLALVTFPTAALAGLLERGDEWARRAQLGTFFDISCTLVPKLLSAIGKERRVRKAEEEA